MSESYPWALCKRLLEAWPDLSLGVWPADPNALEGYRGTSPSESGGFEAAVIAGADIEAAVQSLPGGLAAIVRRRYWDHHGRAPGEPGWNALVDAVHSAVNW